MLIIVEKGDGSLEDRYIFLLVWMVEYYHNRVGFLLFCLCVFMGEEGVTAKEKREKKGKGFFSFKTEAP